MPKSKQGSESKDVGFNIYMSEAMYNQLRELSFKSKRSMSELSREGIQHVVNKYSITSKKAK